MLLLLVGDERPQHFVGVGRALDFDQVAVLVDAA